MWYWHKDRLWNRTSSPEINSYVYGQVISNMGARTIHWGKIIFATNGAGAIEYLGTEEQM